MKKRDSYFRKQEMQYGGFCGFCGEGLEPVLNMDYETFGLCKDPKGHDLKVKELFQAE